MRFVPTAIDGVVVVEQERKPDERGYFARTWSAVEFGDAGLDAAVVECSISHNTAAATLRGMHLQRHPHEETKLVRCSVGSIFDVAVDARIGSAQLGRWVGIELSAANGRALLIPPGCAHGFVTLAPGTEVLYQISPAFVASAAGGFRWDDPDVGIRWPVMPAILSERDRTMPSFADLLEELETDHHE